MNTSLHSTEALLSQVSWLRELALELVQDHGEAEDLAQEAILRALERPPREPSAMRGFLRRVSRNIWLDRVRSESRRREREEVNARAEAVPATDDLVDRLTMHRRLVEAVDQLEEPYRTTILLRYFDGLPPREIAERQRAPVKTVNTRLQRGLERLRAELDRRASGNRRQWALALLPLVAPLEPRLAPAGASARSFAVAGGALAVIVAAAFVWLGGVPSEPRTAANAFVAAAHEPKPLAAALDEPTGELAREAVLSAASESSARKLAGRIVTAEGAPLPRASVVAFFRPAAGIQEREGDFARAIVRVAQAVSTEDGRFEIEVPENASYRLEARAPGFGTEIRDDAIPGDDVILEMKGAGRFEFTVVHDEDETPCANARLRLSRTGVVGSAFDGETDNEGRAPIDGLAPGVYLVEVTPRAAQRVFTIDLVLRAGERVQHILRARTGTFVEGSVKSSVDGSPIAGARVIHRPNRIATTDTAGRFELRGLPASQSRISLEVEADGFALSTSKIDPKTEDRVELTALPEARVSGRLVGANGAAVPSAWVIVGGREARSEADGSFVVRGLSPESAPACFVRATGRASLVALAPRELAAGDNDWGTLALEESASVAGRVLTPDGQPIANATVTLKALGALEPLRAASVLIEDVLVDDETIGTEDVVGNATTAVVGVGSFDSARPSNRNFFGAPDDSGPFRDRTVRASSAGRFRIFDLPAGHYQISARAQGRAVTAPIELDLGVGEDRSDIELAVARGSTIAGRVRAEDGTPIAGAWVVLVEPTGRRTGINSSSALDGSFVLQGVAAGSYELDVTFHGLVAGRAYTQERILDLAPPVRDLDVILSPLAFIEGVLVDDANRPIADVFVRATDTEWRRVNAPTDERGRFQLGVVEGRTATLDVIGPVERRAISGNSKVDPQWKGELAGVTAGTTGVVLRATREP